MTAFEEKNLWPFFWFEDEAFPAYVVVVVAAAAAAVAAAAGEAK